MESEIRLLITSSTKLTEKELETYHKELAGFLNRYASHRNINFNDNVSSLSKAYEISKSYFEWLKELLRPSTNEPERLKDCFPKFRMEILKVLSNDI